MKKTEKPITEDKDLGQPTDSQQTVSEEVSEPLSDIDESFLHQDAAPTEEFTIGETKVVFKEETESTPMDDVTPAVQPDAKVGTDFWNADEDWVATTVGNTPSGNVVQVKKRTGGSGYTLSLRDGGVLPNLYSGWYTSFDKAKDAAAEYINFLRDRSAEATNA